jgi:tetratricopeptide (TPR) repeat protein
MSRNSVLFAAIAALALGGLAMPALADFSACEGALQTKDVKQKIDLYTICLNKGGLVATDRAGAYNNRGVAYLSIGEFDNALQDFTWSIENDPNWGTFYENRGEIYLRRREWAKAEADFTAATHLSPLDARTRAFALRGQLRMLQGQYQAALADYDAALKWDRKIAPVYAGEAWLLATCPDARLRDGKKAVQLAQQGLKLEDQPALHDALAAAYAELGQFDDAVREQEKAIEQNKDGRQEGWTGAEARLELYKKGSPFRTPPVAAAQK